MYLKTLEEIIEIEGKIGYTFKDRSLIITALTHTSFVNELEQTDLKSNQRLEFLGDAILQVVTSEFLFNNYANMPEGNLTKLRAKIVCEPNLHKTSEKLVLGKHLILSHSEGKTGGFKKPSIQSDMIEAIIGAIYIDSGVKSAKKFIMDYIEMDPSKLKDNKDYKSTLQEYIQKISKSNVTYDSKVIPSSSHLKTFTSAVWHFDKKLGEGKGTNKKKAEQDAAKNALEKLGLVVNE